MLIPSWNIGLVLLVCLYFGISNHDSFALEIIPMSPPSLYLTCPAYAMYGPVDRQKNIDLANWLCARMGWTLTVSPLMSRYMGKGSYLPANIRIEDFREALRHEVIWACRGGFGSIEIVDAIL